MLTITESDWRCNVKFQTGKIIKKRSGKTKKKV